jgi:hypothetical protein
MTSELDFALKLAHYDDDYGQARDPGRVQPRGRELVQLLEHKAALVARSGLYFDLLPVDQEHDPVLAEMGKWALRWELFNWEKRFQECEDNVVMGALAARHWAMKVEFDPDLGPYGEIVFREVDGRTYAWADGYQSPHDPQCPWFTHWERVPVKTVEGMEGWNGTSNLVPDDGEQISKAKSGATTQSGAVAFRPDPDPAAPDMPDDQLMTVVTLYERNVKEFVRHERGFRVLRADERYLQCVQCGYKSLPQADEQADLAREVPGGCEDCGGDLERIDSVVAERKEPKWPGGKRMTIFAPLQPEVRIFKERGWPLGIRALPFMFLAVKPHPSEPVGQSETSTNWTMQVSSNWMMRMGLEMMKLAKPYYLLPRVGIEDAVGQKWQFGDDQGIGIFYTNDTAPAGVQTLQGSGLPTAWNVLWEAIQGNFRANMGSTDIGLTPQQSRDIAVGTIRELIASAEIPVDHLIRRLRRARTVFFNVIYQMIRKTYTPARWTRLLGPDGEWRVMELYGAELPDYDVHVTAEPDLAEIKSDELQNLIEFASAPPPVQEFIRELKNLPISAVRRLQENWKRYNQEQLAQAIAMGGAVGPGAGTGKQAGTQQRNGSALSSLPLNLQRRIGGATHGALK